MNNISINISNEITYFIAKLNYLYKKNNINFKKK